MFQDKISTMQVMNFLFKTCRSSGNAADVDITGNHKQKSKLDPSRKNGFEKEFSQSFRDSSSHPEQVAECSLTTVCDIFFDH